MIDAKRLLDQFLGQGLGNSGGTADWNPSGHQRGANRGAGILDQVQGYARNNPMLAGGLAGGLASILLGSKGGRKLATTALTYGGVAAIGGLAYKAYRDYQDAQASRPISATHDTQVLPPPSDSPFAIENAPQGANAFALDLVTAMITAAKADGHIDADERNRILGKLSQGGLSSEEEAFLSRELAAPLDIERIVRAAETREEAVELYAASFLAIAPDHPAERGYLDMLAARLGLEPELARTIERTVAAAQV